MVGRAALHTCAPAHLRILWYHSSPVSRTLPTQRPKSTCHHAANRSHPTHTRVGHYSITCHVLQQPASGVSPLCCHGPPNVQEDVDRLIAEELPEEAGVIVTRTGSALKVRRTNAVCMAPRCVPR